jgi:electron transport complex protein RnfE
MLAPLIGATGSLVTALGVWLMFIVVISTFGLGMNALRPRLLRGNAFAGPACCSPRR